MKGWLGGVVVACLLLGCGNPDAGPPLGAFPAITKTASDAPFTLTAPSSRSPAAFVFTSSDPKVATIEGATVTIHGAGTSTITASQPSIGSYGPTSATTTLTVGAVPCDNGAVLVDGTCTLTPTVTVNGLIWVAVTATNTWTGARDYCANTVINSVAGWRQPSAAELQNLVAANAIAGSNWAQGEAWSASAGIASGTHVVVSLTTGVPTERADAATGYVSCVR